MLPRMPTLTVAAMREIARSQGFEWTDAELEALRPVVERTLTLLEKLETVPPPALDPGIQFRMF
jgi:hypothetical protein